MLLEGHGWFYLQKQLTSSNLILTLKPVYINFKPFILLRAGRWKYSYPLKYNFTFVYFRGTSGIDIDLRRVDIDQCPLPSGSTQLNIFAASDKCKNRTTEVSSLPWGWNWIYPDTRLITLPKSTTHDWTFPRSRHRTDQGGRRKLIVYRSKSRIKRQIEHQHEKGDERSRGGPWTKLQKAPFFLLGPVSDQGFNSVYLNTFADWLKILKAVHFNFNYIFMILEWLVGPNLYTNIYVVFISIVVFVSKVLAYKLYNFKTLLTLKLALETSQQNVGCTLT